MIKLLDILYETKVINEMSEGTLKKMIDLYKTQTTDKEDQIKANIKRFEQLANSIAKKVQDNNPLIIRVLPDELKKPNNVRDITKYDYETLVRVIKASDTKSTDPYKQAIEYYKKQNIYMQPTIIGNYVSRFKTNVNDLVQKVHDRDEEAISTIPKEILKKDAFKDILQWRSFEQLENMLDSIFPIISDKSVANDASTDADKIYEKDGIEVYKGDEEHKCIRHGHGYPWCIGKSMYGTYRYNQGKGSNRAFYFIFDRNASKDNKWHVVVLHAREDGKFMRTSAKNDGDEPHNGCKWEELGAYFPGADGKQFWDKIKNLGYLFKFINPNPEERRRMGFRGQRATLEQFADFSHEDKRDWLRANASDRNLVTSEIVKSLPAFGEDVSKNDLINNGREFKMDELKPTSGLIKRYAEYSTAHRQERPLPTEFIPYFKDETKENYFKKFEKNYLRFDIIEKYFGPEITKRYTNTEVKELGYLPPEAEKYIVDPKEKQLFELYSKLIKNWVINESTSTTDDDLKAAGQNIRPVYLNQKQWLDFSPEDQKNLIELAKKLNGKAIKEGKYEAVMCGMPFIIVSNGGKNLLVLQHKDVDNEFIITYSTGKAINNEVYSDIMFGSSENTGHPFALEKVFPINEVKIKGKPFVLKENKFDNWDQYTLKRKAGLIK